MLGEVFYWVLNMSISAAVTGGAVYLITRINRLPRRIACLMWIIPFIRMAVPFGMGSRFSLMTLLSTFTTKTVTVPSEIGTMSVTNYVMAANNYRPITYKVNIFANIFAVCGIIWLIVALALLIALGAIYFSTLKELRGAVKLYGNVFVSDKVTSPAVYGIIRPRIILPAGCAGAKYVIAHEQAHIKRADNLRRAAAIFITALHWFNPLAWLWCSEFLKQTELACDERVLAAFTPRQRTQYALTLLNHAGGHEVFASAFGGAKVRLRISRIVSYKKLSAASACAFSLLALVIAYVLLTNAA